MKRFEVIHPRDWGLHAPKTKGENSRIEHAIGIDYATVEQRVRHAVKDFLDRLYDEDEQGLRHYYRADTQYVSELDAGNFMMAMNYLVVYDMDGDGRYMARDVRMMGYDLLSNEVGINLTEEVDRITARVRERTGLNAEPFYGVGGDA